MANSTHTDHRLFAAHCPPGYRFRMNLEPDTRCFRTEAEARRWAADVLHLPPEALVLIAGHYAPDRGAPCSATWTRRRGGYLVFQRKQP